MNKLKSQKYLKTQYITNSVAGRSRVKYQQNETYDLKYHPKPSIIFSRKSHSTITNVRPSVCLSVINQNPSTA